MFAQETVTVSQPANLRANANRSSQIIQVLNPGDQITILESVSGNTVWLNGVESNVWYRVQLNDGTIGFVWSGLVRDTAEVVNTAPLAAPATSAQYPELVCSRCRYRDLTITEMTWRGSTRAGVANPQALFDLIYRLPARNIWVGYENGGFDLPADAAPEYTLRFTAALNVLDWPLIYQGQAYNRLELPNDQIEVWFLYSQSTGEGYVFPFISLTPTSTPSGEHEGSHLWGAYAVPWSAVEALDQTIQAGI